MLYLSLVFSLVVLSGLIIPLILVRPGQKLLKQKHYLYSKRPTGANVGSAQYWFREIYLMQNQRYDFRRINYAGIFVFDPS